MQPNLESSLPIGSKAPPSPAPLSFKNLTSRWSSDEPVVSVICATYMHEAFIEDALCGFLAQETNFAFEILIRDDGSSDRTPEIIEEYAKSFPGIIKARLPTVRGYPKIKSGSILKELAIGKYYALCEGDDYWSDPSKLQTQVSLLENNPWAVMSHHRAVNVSAGGIVLEDSSSRYTQRRNLSGPKLQRGVSAIWPSSIVQRSADIPRAQRPDRIVNGDEYRRSQLGAYGGSVYARGLSPAVRRVHPGGVWSQLTESDRPITQAESFYWIGRSYQKLENTTLANYFIARAALSIIGSNPKAKVVLIGLLFRGIYSRFLGLIFPRF